MEPSSPPEFEPWRPSLKPIDREWFFAALQRSPYAVLAALLAGWGWLWPALWAAAGGAIYGAIAGGTVGLASAGIAIPGAEQATGAVGAVSGAGIGAVFGFTSVYGVTLWAAGVRIVVGLLSGALLAVLITAAVVLLEPWMLQLRGYRRMSRREAAKVMPVLADVGAAMGLTAVPPILIADNPRGGAWTHTRHIVITTGLMELRTSMIAGVLAHELHHWSNGDAVAGTFVWACAWPVAVAYNLLFWLRRFAGKGVAAVASLVLWPAWMLLKLLIAPVMAHEGRQHEYEADAAAAGAGYRDGIAAALVELRLFERARTGWEGVLTATHPPIELRLEALESFEATEPGAGWTAPPVPGTLPVPSGRRRAEPSARSLPGPRQQMSSTPTHVRSLQAPEQPRESRVRKPKTSDLIGIVLVIGAALLGLRVRSIAAGFSWPFGLFHHASPTATAVRPTASPQAALVGTWRLTYDHGHPVSTAEQTVRFRPDGTVVSTGTGSNANWTARYSVASGHVTLTSTASSGPNQTATYSIIGNTLTIVISSDKAFFVRTG